MCLTFVPVSVFAEDLQQDNSISVLSITPDEGTYRTYVFKANGETISTQIVKNGDTLLEPQVPAQDGKVFTGWDKTVPFGVIAGLAGDNQIITVNAQFEDGYHVYFKDDNGRIIATKTGKTGDTITFADVSFPVNADKAITGWYTDKDYTEKVDSVTINGADITLYAKVETGYWLTFESNGGSYVAPAFYAKDTPATAPDEPTKSGYTFAGWYTDKNLMTAANFGNITATTILYAKWTEDTNTSYTVIHWLENADDDGYSYEESETKTGTTGGKTNAQAKSYTGFTAQIITQETIAGDGSTIVSVKYTRNAYEVKFFTDRKGKNEDTSKRITAKYGANIRKQWPGGSWYVNKSGSTAQTCIDTMPLNGKNFYGKQQGTSSTGHYYIEVLPGQDYTETRGSKHYALDHSDFAPWGVTVSKEDRYNMTGFTCNEQYSAKNGRFYDGAQFFYDRNSYDLVFISGGKTVKTESVKYQASIAGYANYKHDTAPEGKDGYIFAGWYASQECTGDAYDFTGKTMPAQRITLYAKWVAPTYTVTVYDQNGTKLDEITVSKGDTVTDWLSTQKNELPLDTGDSFLGWTIKRGLPFNPGTKITTNYELYAKVGNSTGYSVTYNANGGTGSMTDTESYAKGAKATVKSNNGFTNGDKVFLSWNTAADGTGKTYYPNSTVEITGNVTLYARWGDKASTVSVTYHSNFAPDQTKSVAAVANNSKITVEAYNALNLPERTGYSFDGWNTKADGTGRTFAAGAFARVDVTEPNDLYAQWAPNTDTKYTVEFYYQDGDSYWLDHSDPRTGTTDATVSVTNADKEAKENGKYVYDTTAANVESGIVAADGSLVLKLYFKLNQFQLTINYVYADGTTAATSHSETLTVGEDYSVDSPEIEGYTPSKDTVSGKMPAENVVETVTYTKRTDLSYTVHYYWNGTTESVKPSETFGNQTYQDKVTKSPAAIDGYTAVSKDSKTITIGTGTNVIIFYYYKNVELTANSGTATYDGNEHSVSGFTGAPADADFSAITVGAKGTNVGTYPASFAEGTVGTVDANKKYIVTEANNGQLKINPVTDKVTVTIKGHKDTKTYDGKEHSVTGYDVTITGGNNQYTANDFSFSGTKTITGTNVADSKDMGLNAEQFANTNTNFTNVEFVVEEDGKLTIEKRNVTLTSGSASKEYDGTPLTKDEVNVTSGSFADGEGATYDVTGTVTLVDNVKNTFTYTLNANTKAENYNITKVEGDLEITDRAEKYEITVKANSGEKTYDGTPLDVSGFENLEFTVNGQIYTVSGLTASKTGTNVSDSGAVEVTGTVVVKDANDNDVTKQFTVNTEDGKLTINPRNVTLTSGNASKQYDGTPLTKDEVKVTGDGFADGEGATYDVTGAITNVAENKPNNNTFTYTLSEGTTAGNYVIEIMYGTLEITPVAAEVTVEIKGHTTDAIYDATEKTAEGYDVISISNELYTANDFALTGKDKVTGIAAGEYDMGLAFENISKNFSKVTFVVEDGKLTIAKRDVTVTGESATKVYNGQTQEINGYTVDNLVEGHKMTGVTYSAKGKDPGKYDGSFTGSQIVIKDADGNYVTTNYNVKTVIGALTITQPSRPTRPSTPTKDVTSVKTADGSQMTLWMSMMLASAAGIVFLGKKRKEEQ